MESLKKVNVSLKPYKAKPSSETGSTDQRRISKPNRERMGNTNQANGNLFPGALSSSNNPHCIKKTTQSNKDLTKLAELVISVANSFYCPEATAKEAARDLLVALSRFRSDAL